MAVETHHGNDRGVSREYVMKELCRDLDIPCIEKNIDPYDVYTSDEAFITGTPFCMLPVTSLNNLDIGDGKVGPIFSKLINLWSENTGIDIIKQITTWDLDNQVEEGDDVPTPYRFSKK